MCVGLVFGMPPRLIPPCPSTFFSSHFFFLPESFKASKVEVFWGPENTLTDVQFCYDCVFFFWFVEVFN